MIILNESLNQTKPTMKTRSGNFQRMTSPFLTLILLLTVSCSNQGVEKLMFIDYPGLQIGFTTQNFQRAMPNNTENITEMIEYAASQGYQFIQLRDNHATLTTDECEMLAEIAKSKKVDIIYEIHINPLDPGFNDVFEKGLSNTLLFPGPGILRTVISLSEFISDPDRKGWNEQELLQLTKISDSCALVAREKNIKFIVENFNEAFFGDGETFFGIADFFENTVSTGFQFDLSNPFTKTSRYRAETPGVIEFLSTMGDRWVTSHIKTIEVMGGSPLPVLTENPFSVEKVVELMGKQDVIYVSLELAPVDDKQQCFDNHASSIQFMKDIGVLKK